ncbi:MAG: hypothetical protein IPK32_20975 [Verrucomicrobiaceae bacterium]|nr:hypothetical protein [Verrucomicrobiaceae bacterium]
MQNNPPSATTSSSLPKRSLWRHPLVITLCVLLGLAGIATAAAGIWWKTNFDPDPFKPVALTAQEQQEFDTKLAAFSGEKPPAAPASVPTPDVPAPTPTTDLQKRTLVLTENEVNAWLAKNQFGENVQVRFENGKIAADAILVLPDDLPMLAGQKVRIKLALAAHLDDVSRHFAILVEDVTVGGMSLPNAWIGELKGTNLVDQSAKIDPATEQFLKGIRHFEIRDSHAVVTLNE